MKGVEFGTGGVEAILFTAYDDHVCTVFEEFKGDAFTDTAAAACDKGDLVLEEIWIVKTHLWKFRGEVECSAEIPPPNSHTMKLFTLLLLASSALALPGGVFSAPKTDPAQLDPVPQLTNFPLSTVTPASSFDNLDAFAKSLAVVSNTDNRLYNFAKSAATLLPYYAGVVLGNIGGFLAAPTLVGFQVFKPWTRQPHAINWWGAPVLEKAGTAGAIIGLPLFLVSIPFLVPSILLHMTTLQFDKLFYSAEAYRDYLKYINTEMGPLFRLADGKKVDDALPELQRALRQNATPTLLAATKKWIELNPDKANRSEFERLLKEVDKKALDAQIGKVIDEAVKNEKNVVE
jgi:hypothetical protein